MPVRELKYKRNTWDYPIYLPRRIMHYLRYLNDLDIKLLIRMYHEQSICRNPGARIFIRPKELMTLTDCTFEELQDSLDTLQTLKLAFVISKSKRDLLIRLCPPLMKRWISYDENSLEIAYLQTREKDLLRERGQL